MEEDEKKKKSNQIKIYIYIYIECRAPHDPKLISLVLLPLIHMEPSSGQLATLTLCIGFSFSGKVY